MPLRVLVFWCCWFGVFGGNLVFSSLAGLVGLVEFVVTIVVGGVVFRLLAGKLLVWVWVV